MFIQNDFETSRVAVHFGENATKTSHALLAVLPVLLANFYQPKLGRSSTRGGSS